MTRSLLTPQWPLATDYAWGVVSETAEESPQVEREASHLRKAIFGATAVVHGPGITLHKCIYISNYKLSPIEEQFRKNWAWQNTLLNLTEKKI